MKNKFLLKALVIIMFLLVVIGVLYQNKVGEKDIYERKQLSTKEKLKDFNYMVDILEENYPFFEVNKRLHNVDWLANREPYTEIIKNTSSDETFFNALRLILSELNNGHTQMLNQDWYLFMTHAYVNGKAWDSAWAKQLTQPVATGRYGKGDGKGDGLGQGMTLDANNLTTRIIEENKIAYLGIKSFKHDYIEKNLKTLNNFFDGLSNYQTLIIDIRGNGGGDCAYWMNYIVPRLIDKPLVTPQYIIYRGGEFTEDFIRCRQGKGYEELEEIKTLKKENLKKLPPETMKDFKYYNKFLVEIAPKDPVGFKGEVYLLVDKYVYSSAEMFATFAKDTDFATLVGERTGGDGIGMDPALCTLPNSGYVFRYPQQMGLTSTGECNEEFKTEPDIKVNAMKNDNFSKDEAIQAVLKLVRD